MKATALLLILMLRVWLTDGQHGLLLGVATMPGAGPVVMMRMDKDGAIKAVMAKDVARSEWVEVEKTAANLY